MKRSFYSELAYVLGEITLPLGAALMTRAGFGVNMVIMPAYLISEKVDFISFGMAAYLFQAILLAVFCLVMRRFRVKYLISFATAFIYGNILDLWLFILSFDTPSSIPLRVALMIAGIICTVFGVTMFLKSYIPPEVYELFVQGISEKYGFEMGKVKWVYDLVSLALSIGMSFLFFGSLYGVGVGTVLSALVNGPLISAFSKFLDRRFRFKPALRVPKWLA